jgi:predicted thioesterase
MKDTRADQQGTHERFVINKKKFDEKMRSKAVTG